MAALMALPWPGWLFNDEDTLQTRQVFMYIDHYSFGREWDSDQGRYVDTGSSHKAFALRLTNPAYWEDDNDADWYWKLQLGAFFGILAVLVGIIALLVLLSASCFPLEATTLRKIALAHLAASFLSALTLTAFATDLDTDYSDRHAGPAAISMIFASFLFACASVILFQYTKMVTVGDLPRDADESEKTHLMEQAEATHTNNQEDAAEGV
jgi:hypothetical protein